MRASVAARAHRKLRRLERYIAGPRIPPDVLPFVTEVATDLGAIVGCYRNDLDSATDWIVFAAEGLSTTVEGVRRSIRYTDIVRVVYEPTKDVVADEVHLELRSQRRATLPVQGKDVERGTHDKFLVMMFLESVAG